MKVDAPEFPAVRIQRTIAAPAHHVFRAWLDPATLGRWLAPGGFVVKKVEVEERVGGRFSVWELDGDLDIGGFEAEILELVPDRKLAFRWGFVGPERQADPRFDSTLTIELRELTATTTMLTLTHERLEGLAAAMPEVAGGVGRGWELALAKLIVEIEK